MIVKLTLGNAESFPDTQEAAKKLLADGWTLESGVIDQLPKRQIASRETPEGYADIYRTLMARPDLKDLFTHLLQMNEKDQAKYALIMMALIKARAYETRLDNGRITIKLPQEEKKHEEASL